MNPYLQKLQSYPFEKLNRLIEPHPHEGDMATGFFSRWGAPARNPAMYPGCLQRNADTVEPVSDDAWLTGPAFDIFPLACEALRTAR